jgi:hypothetical protein
VDYSDMASDARIEQSVASEILDRTLQYEEREYYRQYDVMTSQAGNIDNKTNAIIEQLTDSLDNEYSVSNLYLTFPCFGRHVKPLVPLQFQGGLTLGRRPVVKIIAESLTQHDENPLSGIR